ncbi:MAG: hypothetical protein JSV20_07200, partial [Candidatus Bathyarchaeota archaeon]
MTDLTLQRILKTVRHEEPDQVPVQLMAIGAYLSGFVGIREREYLMDMSKMFNAQMAFRKKFCTNYDVCILQSLPRPDFHEVIASGFGCKVKWPEDSSPWVFPIINKPEDIDTLELPDPLHDGLMATTIEFYTFMKKKVGNTHFVGPP